MIYIVFIVKPEIKIILLADDMGEIISDISQSWCQKWPYVYMRYPYFY